MSFQWTLIAGFLYFEIGILLLLMLPLACPRRWNKIFRSHICTMFQQHAAIYFYIILGVLALFFFDAIKDMKKYSHSTDFGYMHLSSETKGSVKLFRAQRNFYITGFSIFLGFVIRHIVSMIVIQAQLQDRTAEIIKEAESAKDLAKNTIAEQSVRNSDLELCQETIVKLSTRLELIQENLEKEIDKNIKCNEELSFWKVKYDELAKKGNKSSA